MHPHQSRSRRHSDSNGEDDDSLLPLLVSRVEETRSEAYSRSSKPSSHHSESYRPSSTSGRTSYDSGKEASSSRTYRDSDDWGPSDTPRSSHERYSHSSYKDGYRSGGRDTYDIGEQRNSDAWSNRTSNSHYISPSSGREWTQRHEHNRSSGSQKDWNSSASHGNRTPTWSSEECRSRTSDERGHTRVSREDRHSDRESASWLKEDQRDEGSQSWKRDWEPRRRESHGKGWEPRHTRNEHSHRQTDDRSWEPAPSWQSNRSETHGQRSQNSKSNHTYKNVKTGKKIQQNHKHKRDWRTDDGNLNNWQRREPHQTTSRTAQEATKRRQPYSPSRSRSHSPAESFRSLHSSPGRSRSRSSSPKRRWQDSSPTVASNRTPSDRGRRKTWSKRPARTSSRSPSPRRYERTLHHRRSVSSSSSSRSRSTSRSPVERPKAVHRLPQATSVADIPFSSINLSRTTSMRPPRDIPAHRNGRNRANGRHNNWMSSHELSTPHTVNSQIPSVSDMRRPPIPQAGLDTPMSRPLEASRMINAPSDSSLDIPMSRGNGVSHKSAGFRPIGQISAVKKFFPTDDDDMEITSDRQSQTPVQGSSRSQETLCDAEKSGFLRERDEELPSASSAKRQEFPSIPSIPSPSQLETSHASFRDGIQPPPRERNHEAWHPETTATPNWSQQIPDRDFSEVTRPASPSGETPGELYTIISQVGEGTFGKVYKARNTVTKAHVALKRIRMEVERDGFPVTAMREIKLLQSLQHGNVVRLYEMMVSHGSVYMVFEYMDHDLTGVLSQSQFDFTGAHLKSLCQQMLAGLAYLHRKGVIHRDIKGSNILINNRGELKLADFGLARFYQKRRRSDYTNRVITLWYRPPELLFGATVYGPEVDMWSAGCIMLELFTKKPVFQGNDEIHQLDVIYRILGTPSPDRWSGVMSLPWYELVKPKEVVHNHFRELFQKWLSPAALDLAEQLLAYDPAERVTAIQALEAPYFTEEEPPPALPVGLSTLEGEWHELETKRERAKKRRKIESAVQ